MIDALIITIAIVISLLGILGCILPALPGPPLSFIAVLIVQYFYDKPYTDKLIIILLIITVVVFALDYVLPLIGAKLFNASGQGITLGIIGMILGMIFFPPFGMIIGLFIGAIVGELMAGKEHSEALKVGFVSFLFTMLMMIIKLGLSGYMAYLVFSRIFIGFFS